MLKKSLKYIISLTLAIILLWFSFRDVEWSKFIEGLKACNWWLIVLSMVAGAFAFWLRGLRWRQLLLPFNSQLTRTTTFNGINIGNISNIVFPRLGEFVRCGVIVRRSNISYNKVLGTVVLERVWELLVMLMLGFILIIGSNRFVSFFVDEIWTKISMKFNMWWAILIAVSIISAFIYIIWRLRKQNAICGKIANIFKGILQGFASCLQMEKKWKFFFYTLLIWMIYWFMACCTVWATPFLNGLDIIDALFISLVGGLGFTVPVPGGIGAFHFIIALTLTSVYKIDWDAAMVYATISHSSQAITQIIFGLFSYGYEALKK